MQELTKPPYFLEYMLKESHRPPAEASASAGRPPSGDDRHSDVKKYDVRRSEGSSRRAEHSSSSATRQVPRPAPAGGYTARQERESSAATRAAGYRAGNGGQSPSRHQGAAERQEFVPTAHTRKLKTSAKKRAWSAAFRQAGYPVGLAKAYSWKVESAEPVANVVKVATSRGRYALKRTHISPERVEFIHKATQYLRKQGFQKAPRFALTSDKLPSVEKDGHTYYATQWIDGNNVNFASLSQLGQLARTLAEFHELSRGFEWNAYNPPYEFGLATMIRRRTADLKNLLIRAETRENPDEFDQVLTRLAPRLRQDAEKSLRIAEDNQCNKFLLQDEEHPGLCHLDVIPGNFVYTADKEIYVLDLDLSTFAPRVLDLAHLLRRSLQQLNWQPEAAYTCFVHYDAVRPMTAEEYLWVQCLLTFPYRVWRLAHTRFHVFRDRRQTEELKEISAQEARRQAFLEEYGRQIMREVD